MTALEKIISVIAPYECESCGAEGFVLCKTCEDKLLSPTPPRCYRCRAFSVGSRVCKSCKSNSALRCVWVGSEYSDFSRKLVGLLKFDHVRGAADDMARYLAKQFPELPQNAVLVPVSTASSRVRSRGYDQAILLCRELGKHSRLKTIPHLARMGQSRQVGTKRGQRLKQLEGAYRLRYASLIKGAHIILVDDVLTTGATIEMAARDLRKAGAKHVDAVVFAQA